MKSNDKVNLKDVLDLLFVKRNEFKNLSDENKQKFGFIINRLLSRKYPDVSLNLNYKTKDYITVLNIWWLILFNENKNYHSWIWPSSQKKNKNNDEEISMMMERYPDLKKEDILYLRNNFEDFYNNEIKQIKKEIKDYG